MMFRVNSSASKMKCSFHSSFNALGINASVRPLIMRNVNKLRDSKKLPAKRDELSFDGTQDGIRKGDRTSKVP